MSASNMTLRRYIRYALVFWKFKREHKEVLQKFKFSPLDGKRLNWVLEIRTDGPYDPKTGEPTKVGVQVWVRSDRSDYIYDYDTETKKLTYVKRNGYDYSVYQLHPDPEAQKNS